MNPSFDQENDNERRREADGVQGGGGHRVGVVGPVDGLVAAEESILVWYTNERKHCDSKVLLVVGVRVIAMFCWFSI